MRRRVLSIQDNTVVANLASQEKQAESIVEKLCQRFRLTEEPRQWQDIAYCLSLLPFKSDRSVKKLIEGLPFYQDKLHNEGVFARFSEILAKACLRSRPNLRFVFTIYQLGQDKQVFE